MNSLNSFEGVVKILETPIQQILKDDISVTKVRAQLPQIRNTTIVTLIFWGKLARDVADYYKANDYIIIEGYLSVSNQLNFNQVKITGLKIYPFPLNSNLFVNKI
jgi:hypothetical protein